MSTRGMGPDHMNATLPIAGGDALRASAVPADTARKRHAALVRATHWLTTLAFLALLLSGGEIVLSHPRFYWGETGNVNMRPWLNLHLPSSRSTVPTGYGYVLPDQNGWSRYLHFQAAWVAVATGLLYLLWGLFNGHFRRNLVPRSFKGIGASIIEHLRFKRPGAEEAWSYNVLQRITYLVVIFVLFPLMIWTGLAMSFGFDAAFPLAVRLLGGHQTARSLHFIVTILLVLFLLVHVLMVIVAGFRARMSAMITGRATPDGVNYEPDLSTQTHHQRYRGCSRNIQRSRRGHTRPASRTDSARFERHLRAGRNLDLCGAPAVDPPFDGPGIFPQRDFEESVCQ
jgi:thiosulfate reductase cytochrome b subunit